MRKRPLVILVISMFAVGPVLAVDSGAVIGGAIGGGAGAAVGSEVGGRDGAIVGGAVGGAIGAAIGADDEDSKSKKSRVDVIYHQDGPHYRSGPPGHAYGHRVPPGHAKHQKQKHK